MRVIAKKPLLERIEDELEILHRENRPIDYIELTESEAKELRGLFGFEWITKRFEPNSTRLMGHPVKIIPDPKGVQCPSCGRDILPKNFVR